MHPHHKTEIMPNQNWAEIAEMHPNLAKIARISQKHWLEFNRCGYFLVIRFFGLPLIERRKGYISLVREGDELDG